MRYRVVVMLFLVLLAGSLTAGTISVSGGLSTLNSLKSEKHRAFSFDYHQPLGAYIDWSISFLNEGHPGTLRRDGIASQLWLYKQYLDERLLLEIGVGPYANADTMPLDTGDSSKYKNRHGIAGLVSIAVQYHTSENTLAQFTWHRVVSDTNRDTDLFLIGIGWNPAGRGAYGRD